MKARKIAFICHHWLDVDYHWPLYTPPTPSIASKESIPYSCNLFEV